MDLEAIKNMKYILRGYYKLKKLCETLNTFFLFFFLKIEFWKLN